MALSNYIYLISTTLALVLSPTLVNCFANGAPKRACVTMTPIHSKPDGSAVQAQTIPVPYTMKVLTTDDKPVVMYTPGTKLKVSVTGTNPFQGIFLQVRPLTGNTTMPVGTFQDFSLNTKVTTCTAASDSWTHANQQPKPTASVVWNPPSTDVGDVQFVATIAKEKVMYWVKGLNITIKGKSATTPVVSDSTTKCPTAENGAVIPRLGVLVACLCTLLSIKFK